MRALIRTLVVAAVMMGGVAPLRAAEKAPPQEPVLRIEAGMHTAAVQAISVSADGKLIVTGSDDKTARLWSLADGKLLKTFRIPVAPNWGGRIFAIALSPDGRTLAVAGYDANFAYNGGGHFVYLFDTVEGRLTRRLGPLRNIIGKLAFSLDGTRLAAGMWGSFGIAVWDAPFTQQPFIDALYANNVLGLDFAPDGSLATASWDKHIRIYDRSLSLVVKAKAPSDDWPQSVAYSPDGSNLAVGYYSAKVVDYVSPKDLKFVAKADASKYANYGIAAIDWRADGAVLYAGGQYYAEGSIFPVIAWGQGATTYFYPPEGPHDTMTAIVALPNGGLAYSSVEPRWGTYDSAGRPAITYAPVIADMREKITGNLWSSRDGSAVWFGLARGKGNPFLFDINRLSFDSRPEIPADFITAVTDRLDVEWNGQIPAKLNKKPLQAVTQWVSRSLAMVPGETNFMLGTDSTLDRFDETGQLKWRVWPEGAAHGVNMTADGKIVIATLGDGTIRWYRASDGVELLAFFVHAPDRKWIAWTPKGYYAASPGGEDLIGWLVNGKTWDDIPDFFPASRFRDRFYRPDIVQQVLITQDEAKAVQFADAAAGRKTGDQTIQTILPAVVELAVDSLEIKTDRRDIEIPYKLRSPSGREITRLEVLIDGRPVTTRGVVSIEDDAEVKTLSLSVPPRDSEITLVAYIDEQPGVPVSIPIRWTGEGSAGKKPNLFALIVGVSKYDDTSLRLNFAAKDAEDFAAMLERQRGVYYKDVEIKLLLDGEVTEKALQIELTKLKNKSTENDNVIVFMAGHGVTTPDQDFYFLPTDANIEPDMLTATAIDGDIVRKGLSKIPGKVVLFLDACYSGNGIASGRSAVDMTGVSNSFSSNAGVVMFASSSGREVSYEDASYENGAFTEALLSIFTDPKAYNDDKLLSIAELDEALTTMVDQLTEGKQTPVMTKPGAIKRFFVAAM